jgi:hypothetical protein
MMARATERRGFRGALIGAVVGALAAALSGGTARAQKPDDASVVQKIGHGEINWSKKTVTASGSGAADLKDQPVAVARLKAERAAKLDALRNIMETLQGVQIDAKRSAGDLMTNGTIRTQVQAIAQGFKVTDTKYYSDGSVDVIVSMPIDENLTNALNVVPEKKKKVSTTGSSKVTGLIVNAKGLGVLPSISPRILDEKGEEVYSAAMVSDEGIKQGGIAAYVSDPEEATASGLAGQAPVAVKGLRVAEKTKTDIVIANADADKLRDPATNQSFLSEGKVVIVVD